MSLKATNLKIFAETIELVNESALRRNNFTHICNFQS